MGELPEGRQPLTWKDMPFADRPRGHPSTERLEIEKLRARVANLEAVLGKLVLCEDAEFYAGAIESGSPYCIDFDEWHKEARAALQENKK